MNNWIFTLSIVPGIGMFIVSTSYLSIALSAEIDLLINRKEKNRQIIQGKIRQLKRLNISTSLLYLSAILIVAEALFSGLFKLDGDPGIFQISLLIGGVFFFVIALLVLIIYSFKAVKIKQRQFMSAGSWFLNSSKEE